MSAGTESPGVSLAMLLHRQADRRKVTVVLGAYFDESGTHANPLIFSFAGYLFTIQRLRKFERDWAIVLSEFGVPAFHASDLENGTECFRVERRTKELICP